MFTGLIQGLGEIAAAERRGQELRLKIRPLFELTHVVLGESIAVNGVCLTVEEATGGTCTMYASGETISRTNLGGLATGSRVNLERALAMGDRLGGHLVSGHVDCLARVESVRTAGESRVFRLAYPEEHSPLVVPKGSVALDGISLTVNDCGQGWLEVNIIPATQRETTISSWKRGDAVNMETDLIGKYVQRMLSPYAERTGGSGGGGAITEDFLRKHGF